MVEVIDKAISKIHSGIKLIPQNIIIDNGSCSDTVFVAGSARSGTTWLQDMINFENKYRVIFEPFHPKKNDKIRDWRYFQYIHKKDDNPKFKEPMHDILCGKIHNKWINRYNKKIFPRKRIIKSIHANLFLSWLHHQFPDIPIVLILRHPCAVVNSKMNIIAKWFKEPNLNLFLDQKELMDDFLRPFEAKIRATESTFEKFILMWCIETYIPLKQFQDNEIYVTFYENLCLCPEEELKGIFSYLGKPLSRQVVNNSGNPSVMTQGNSAINLGADLISAWHKNISKDQIKRAVEILSSFGLDAIYDAGDLPLMTSSLVLRVL